jgi:hypothetical protein
LVMAAFVDRKKLLICLCHQVLQHSDHARLQDDAILRRLKCAFRPRQSSELRRRRKPPEITGGLLLVDRLLALVPGCTPRLVVSLV